VFSLEPELSRLRDEGVLPAEAAASLIARERREVVSLYAELRFLTWGGVMLIMTGLGVVLAHHLDEIGPLAIATLIALAAAACYAYALIRRRANRTALVDDYILLLGALLASADVGFIEHQFNHRYLLPLIVFHAVTAYFFRSRLVLSVALGALATYLGIERRAEFLWRESGENAQRAFLCAAIVFTWRFLDARYNTQSTFTRVFDHFATNIAFFGALAMMTDSSTRDLGCLIAVVFAVASAIFGVRAREEAFVIYAWIYGVIAIDVFVVDKVDKMGSSEDLMLLYLIVSTIAAIVGLFITHARLRRSE
jgi:hypothetical protein